VPEQTALRLSRSGSACRFEWPWLVLVYITGKRRP